MGMEDVELIMRVEDRFQVSLSDEDAQKMLTVGDLHEWLLAKVCTAPDGPCLSSAAFYRIRKALIETCGTSRNAVKPDSDLEQLVPTEGRPERWEQLGSAIGCRLRPLRYTGRPRPGLLGKLWLNVEMVDPRIPRQCATVRDIVNELLATGFSTFVPPSGVWREDDVWQILREEVSAVTAGYVPVEKITRESRFREDLGFG